MPSGRTHDRITIWTLPLVAGFTFWQTRNSHLTLIVAGGFMFGGLMFGPDLDIYSVQYQRWGWLRFIWLPYQKSLRHRSFLSHGPLIGTTLRVLYLSSAIAVSSFLCLLITEKLGHTEWTWREVSKNTWSTLWFYNTEFIFLFMGMEAGAMSHSLSDWSGSAYKRFRKKGIQGLLSSTKSKKRKSTAVLKGSTKPRVKPSIKSKRTKTTTTRKSSKPRDR
ncbi:MAG: metal-binding protein [Cyanobacteria bacterium P01_A01_bin.45]